MTDRPILFSAPMIRAILAGTKTQTRRVLKPVKGVNLSDLLPGQPHSSGFGEWMLFPRDKVQEPKISPGDRLWVKETFVTGYDFDEMYGTPVGDKLVWYRATDSNLTWCDPDTESTLDNPPWKPSIHMPRRLSRITLIVEDVRVERLQDISEADAIAEGLQTQQGWAPQYRGSDDLPWVNEWPRDAYAELWNKINGPNAWEANPWVAAYTFQPIFQNIVQVK